MRTVFIIHGAYGNSHENWIPWLKKELEALGNKVITPDFPTPQGQSLTAWMNIFSTYKQDIDENTVFVDHSLGCAFILSVLEEDREKPVRACYLVSGFAGPLGDARFDAINKTFTIKKFDWEKIKGNCERFVLFHSDNDPYVPMEKCDELAEKLKGKQIIVEGGWHFNEQAGYHAFPLLLKRIKPSL